MQNSLYVISGVCGMTGNELARQIVKRGQYVLGFDNFFASSIDTISDILENLLFEFYEYDINDSEEMGIIYAKVNHIKHKYDKVIFINCAAVVHTEHFYNIYETFETNVIGMNNFLKKSIEIGCDQYINCSTSEIYSMQSFSEDGGVKESDYILFSTAEHSQRTSYAAGKLLTEFFMKDVVDKGLIKGCSIRFANVYSKNENLSKHIIPHIINTLQNTNTIVLLENSRKNQRTFLHNSDSCSAILALSDNDSALDGTVYNVATDEEITIVNLAEVIAEKLGIKKIDIKFEGYRSSDPERRLLNTEKIRKATNWEPIVCLSAGLDVCVKYIKEKETEH